MITLTEAAQKKVQEYISELKENEGKFLRVYVQGGGCSGFEYGLTFDHKKDEDQIFDYTGFQVVVDPASASYLQGVVIDYTSTIGSEGFNISNPNANSTCGCGKSFS